MCVAHGVLRATSPQRVDIKSSQTLAQGAVATAGLGAIPTSAGTCTKATPNSRGVISVVRRLARALTRRVCSLPTSLACSETARERLEERLRVRDLRGWDAGILAAPLEGLVAAGDIAAGDMPTTEPTGEPVTRTVGDCLSPSPECAQAALLIIAIINFESPDA